MRHRNNVISIRASDVEYNVIKNLAGDAKETMTEYIIASQRVMKKERLILSAAVSPV